MAPLSPFLRLHPWCLQVRAHWMPDTTLGAKVTNTNKTSPLASNFSEQMQTVINHYKLKHEKTELCTDAVGVVRSSGNVAGEKNDNKKLIRVFLKDE